MAGEIIEGYITREEWHQMSEDAFKLEAATTALAQIIQLFDVVIDPKLAGEESYRIQPRVTPGLPDQLDSLYDEPVPKRTRKLARVDVTLVPYLSVARMTRRDFLLMLSRPGELEKWMRGLQANAVKRVIGVARGALNHLFDTTVCKIAKYDGSAAYEAICASHALPSNSDSVAAYDNSSVLILSDDNINTLYNKALEERGEDGELTFGTPVIAFTGATYAGDLGKALGTGPGAADINPMSGKLRELAIPGLAGKTFGLSMGPTDGGLSLVFPGEVPDAMLPENMRGMEFGEDGRPRVGLPVLSNYGRVVDVPYGCVVGVGAATARGIIASTGLGA